MPNILKRYDGSTWVTILDDTRDNTLLVFATDWSNFGAPFATCKVHLVGGRAYLNGLIRFAGTGPFTSGTIATLPVGFRPVEQQIFSTLCSGATGICRVDATPSGFISLSSTPAASIPTLGWITLSGLNYPIS